MSIQPFSINVRKGNPFLRGFNITVLSSLLVLTGCTQMQTQPEPQPVKTVVETKTVEVVPRHLKSIENKAIIGQIENVTVADWKMKARIDSGATTTSIDARNIKGFERDGKDWVRFELLNRDTNETKKLEKPVSRIVEIKRHGAENQERYVVEMKLTLGSINEKVEVSLNDRSDFTFPVLIGRNFLMDRAVVDVSQEYVGK